MILESDDVQANTFVTPYSYHAIHQAYDMRTVPRERPPLFQIQIFPGEICYVAAIDFPFVVVMLLGRDVPIRAFMDLRQVHFKRLSIEYVQAGAGKEAIETLQSNFNLGRPILADPVPAVESPEVPG